MSRPKGTGRQHGERWSYVCYCSRCYADGRGTRQTPPDPPPDGSCPSCMWAALHAWCPHLDDRARRYPSAGENPDIPTQGVAA